MNKNSDEVFWISAKLNNNNYLIGGAYRPEYHDFLREGQCTLEEHLHSALQQSSKVILIGDLNIDLMQPTNSKDYERRQRLTEVFDSLSMKQLIKRATRVTNTTKTLIDHAWVSDSCSIRSADILEGISDHHGIYLEVDKPEQLPKKKIMIRNYKNYDDSKNV